MSTVKLTLGANSDTATMDDISLYIDGKSVESNTLNDGVLTLNTNESLSAGTHKFAFKSNLNVNEAENATNKIIISKVDLNGGKDATNIEGQDKWATVQFSTTKLVVKAIPTLSSKVSGDDLIITITNSDKEEDITIQGFGIKGNVVTAAFNDKTIDLPAFNAGIGNLTLAAGESVELQLQAAKQSTVQVTAIKVDGVIITSDYSNVGKWTNFKVTPSGDWTSAKYYTFTAAENSISADPTESWSSSSSSSSSSTTTPATANYKVNIVIAGGDVTANTVTATTATTATTDVSSWTALTADWNYYITK